MEFIHCDLCDRKISEVAYLFQYKPSIWERLGLVPSILCRMVGYIYPRNSIRKKRKIGNKVHLCVPCKHILYQYLVRPQNTIEEVRDFMNRSFYGIEEDAGYAAPPTPRIRERVIATGTGAGR